MKTSKIIALILGLFITTPIWYYLLYKILEYIQASELMWFLYWIYLPAGIVLTAIVRLAEKE